MHKRDYIAISGAVRQSHNIAAYSRLSLLTDKLVTIFKADNPLFDEEKFREACKEVTLEDKVNSKLGQLGDALKNLKVKK